MYFFWADWELLMDLMTEVKSGAPRWGWEAVAVEKLALWNLGTKRRGFIRDLGDWH